MVSATWLLKDDSDWTAEDLRGYIYSKMAELYIDSDHDPMWDLSILRSFLGRFDNAVAIARYVYENLGGLWRYTPVTPTSFVKDADSRFGIPISTMMEG